MPSFVPHASLRLVSDKPCTLQRASRVERSQLPADIPNPVWPALCPQDRPRRLPLWLRSTVLGRSDARSSKGLEYHLPRTRERAVWQWHRPARAATRLTPSSPAEPLTSLPGHALPPQQPICWPSASPRACRPPAPPAVLMRARLCTSQARVWRPLRVRPSSWWLRARSLRAARAWLGHFVCCCVPRSSFARGRAELGSRLRAEKRAVGGPLLGCKVELHAHVWCTEASFISYLDVV